MLVCYGRKTTCSSSEHAQQATIVSDPVSCLIITLIVVYSKLPCMQFSSVAMDTLFECWKGQVDLQCGDREDSDDSDSEDTPYKDFVSQLKRGIQVHVRGNAHLTKATMQLIMQAIMICSVIL